MPTRPVDWNMLMLLYGLIADIVLKHDSSLLLLPIAPMVIRDGEKSLPSMDPVLFREKPLLGAWLVLEIITGGFEMPCICLFLR